jgi:hypothetical protein
MAEVRAALVALALAGVWVAAVAGMVAARQRPASARQATAVATVVAVALQEAVAMVDPALGARVFPEAHP